MFNFFPLGTLLGSSYFVAYDVGQTGRSFFMRFREHTGIHNKTLFGEHLQGNKHKIQDI